MFKYKDELIKKFGKCIIIKYISMKIYFVD